MTRSKELSIAGVDAKGITISNNENKVFDNCTWHGIGVMVVKEGNRNCSSYAKFMDPDGPLLIVETTMDTFTKIGQPQNWYAFSSGVSGINFGAVFVQGDKACTELYIAIGGFEKNKALFDWLYDHKEEIQQMTRSGTSQSQEKIHNKK